jgi:hypothetical protein
LADGANPKSLVVAEAAGKAAWMLGVKKFNNFTEKDHQTSVFCFFFGRCKKE